MIIVNFFEVGLGMIIVMSKAWMECEQPAV